MTVGITSSCFHGTVVKPNTANDIEQAVLNARRTLLQRTDEIDSILDAVHMHGNGKRELIDKNERFRKFWIALEALINIDSEDRNITKRIETALIRLYESKDQNNKYKIKSGFEIVKIKDDRIAHFHYAKEKSERVKQLEDVLDDLIRSEVGLCHRGYARRYLEVVVPMSAKKKS